MILNCRVTQHNGKCLVLLNIEGTMPEIRERERERERDRQGGRERERERLSYIFWTIG